VIAHIAAPLLERYASYRRWRLERLWRDPRRVQEQCLQSLVSSARDTEFGLAHGFASIRSVADYQARVPVREYEEFKPSWERVAVGETDITWPGTCRDWLRTSGATGVDKLIPLTAEALASHRKGSWDALARAVSLVGARPLLGGTMLLLGGGSAARAWRDGDRIGEISGLPARGLPPAIRGLFSPASDLGAIGPWDERADAIAAQAVGQDVRLLSGMPPSLIALFERVARHRRVAGRSERDLMRCWPNLSVLIHGGVSFGPYATAFGEWLGRPLQHVEVYTASEGFVAVQTEVEGGLSLMVDYGIFYEFVPVEDLGNSAPRRHTVADVELGRSYAPVVSTPGGLWSYVLGDTVRFTAKDPLRLVITGRTQHYVDVVGERATVEEIERALNGACRRTDSEVVEFTVAPQQATQGMGLGGHEWLVEFRVAPTEPEDFARILDDTLCALNPAYRARRAGHCELRPPSVTALPAGTFDCWARATGKSAGEHKVPRATNDRSVAEALLVAACGAATPLIAAST
jgi:hypothetical protein